MKRPLERILALLTATCLTAALTGCGRDVQPAGNDRLPALTVQITMDLEKTSAFRVLSDPLFAQRVEEELGCRLELQMLPSDMDYNEVALLDVPVSC